MLLMFKRIFNWYRRQKANDKQQRNDFELKQAKEKADELYQIREYNGNIWLTYDGHLVCPVTMFADSAFVVTTLRTLRELYVKDIRGFNIEKGKDDDDVVL